MKLCLFNPEHDYALANNDANFVAPKSALAFAADCASFMLCFMGDDATTLPVSCTDIGEVVAWGWNRAIKRRLQKSGIRDELLPSDEYLDTVRRFAHRKSASEAMLFLHRHSSLISLPRAAAQLLSLDEVDDFVCEMADEGRGAIFKSPYSGNGTGIIQVTDGLTAALRQQCGGILHRQGMVLAEPAYDVVQNFAMEFYCRGHHSEFCGYSLFKTDHFAYDCNLLLSNHEMKLQLDKLLDGAQLDTVKTLLLQYFDEYVAPQYDGPVGVDMFVYREEDTCKLNPMVEINLRHTMGLAARWLFDKHIHPASKGTLRVLHENRPMALLQLVRERSANHPLSLIQGKWAAGFVPLTPVLADTKYAVVAELAD